MLKDFQLTALVSKGDQWTLFRIPLHQPLQVSLAQSWNDQYEAFVKGTKEIDFNPGYTPEEDERFRVKNYVLPEWLQAGAKGKAADLGFKPSDVVRVE